MLPPTSYIYFVWWLWGVAVVALGALERQNQDPKGGTRLLDSCNNGNMQRQEDHRHKQHV